MTPGPMTLPFLVLATTVWAFAGPARKDPPAFPLGRGREGPSTYSVRGAPVQMVDPDDEAVEADLVGGRLRCVDCGGELRPWGHARRRSLRDRHRWLSIRPRRARCRSCRITHVLLPVVALLRRRDLASVIGEALAARHLESATIEALAEHAGVHPDTARGWLRRFKKRSEEIRGEFLALAHRLDPSLGPLEPRGSPQVDALEAIGVAGAASVRRLGPMALWHFVAGASGGRLLSNTSSPSARR